MSHPVFSKLYSCYYFYFLKSIISFRSWSKKYFFALTFGIFFSPMFLFYIFSFSLIRISHLMQSFIDWQPERQTDNWRCRHEEKKQNNEEAPICLPSKFVSLKTKQKNQIIQSLCFSLQVNDSSITSSFIKPITDIYTSGFHYILIKFLIN